MKVAAPETGSFAAIARRALATAAQAPAGRPAGFEAALRDASPGAATALPSTADDPARYLALQAEIYREAERVELTSKVLDSAVGGLKTILQTRM